MSSHPDSALLVLESIPSPEKMRKADYAEYCLLLTEARDKTYYKFTSDSVIRVAEYLLEKGDDRLKARVHYIWGRVQHELMYYDKAQENYLQAISFAQKEKNYPLLLRIYNQCGNLYRNRKLYDKALASLQDALNYCRLADDQDNLPYCLRDIGRIHLLTGETDSTLYYYQQAIEAARLNEDENTGSIIYKELGVAYKSVGKYREAIEAIKYAADINTIMAEDPSSCLTLGSLYLYLNNTDSAAYYLNYAQNSRNPYTTVGANYYRYKLAVQTEDYKQAVYYNELYKAQQDSLDALADKADLSDVIHRLEQEELKNSLELRHVQSQRSYLVILLIVITALGTVVIIYYRYRFKKEKEFTEQQQKLQRERNKFAVIQKQFREQEATLLEQENQLLQLREERKILGDRFFAQTQYKERIYLTDPAFESDKSNKPDPFSMKEIDELKETLNLFYANFTNRLQNKYSLLSEQDIAICCLVKAGAKTRHLAKLLCLNSDSVTKKKRLILKKIDSSSNRVNLSDFLSQF